MSLASSGYVAIPHCPVIFDGANYAEFVAFMRLHMVAFVCGVFFPVRSPVLLAQSLPWLLLHRRHHYLSR